MLIEELFMNGTMIMGPSRSDPNREVGVLAPSVMAGFANRRAAELARDLVEYLQEYAREKPEVAALWCLGIGFILGWKLKPW